jgi:thiamine pyrophosphate-dependent acetolactate synthase large subunit-like protein
MRYGSHPAIQTADVILIVECDVPWIPTQCRPSESARIFHIDVDPLKNLMPLFYIPALQRYTADTSTAIIQLTSHLRSSPTLQATLTTPQFADRWSTLQAEHAQRLADLDALCSPRPDNKFNTSHLCHTLRSLLPEDTIFAVEAVTNSILVADQIRPTRPGQWINCGGGGLGWSGGASLGIKLAADERSRTRGEGEGGSSRKQMVVQIVGDGTFLFSVPSSVYWISHRYRIPILTIVLNNKGMLSCLTPYRIYYPITTSPTFLSPLPMRFRDGILTGTPYLGWNAPRRSMLLVHPEGIGSTLDNRELNISFEPSPDYSGIARAASDGNIHAARVKDADQLEAVLREAIAVVQGGTSAVVDAFVQ